jgi:ATP-dependent DNA helicase PIF1
MQHVADDTEIQKALSNKENVFITGSAGSGKTYLASDYGRNAIGTAITATTGIASLAVKGETIHRFLNLGVNSRPEEAGRVLGKWSRILNSGASWDRARAQLVQNLDTIIIDEVSMMRRDQFELIDVVLSFIKNIPTAFGGVQMVLVGDFFQLPPVVSNSELVILHQMYPICLDPELVLN